MATDGNGNIYLAGITESTTGIGFNGQQVTFGGGSYDAFLVKFNSSGGRVWSTYYGGSGTENFQADVHNLVATDFNGNVYLTGKTNSTNNISSGGFQNTNGGLNDAFLVKFNSSGTRIWATYYGGVNNEGGYGVTTDLLGDIYLSGIGNTQTQYLNFLLKVNTAGNKIWENGTNIIGYDIAADANGSLYIAGSTPISTGIVTGGYQSIYGGGARDAILAKFTNTGNQIGATYFGGPNIDEGSGVAVDPNGKVYCVDGQLPQ